MASSDTKVVVWVGGSSGLGLAAIEDLLSNLTNFHIILGSRAALQPRTQHQLDPLLKKSHSKLTRLECNMASYESVRKFAAAVKAAHPGNIDGLVLCAGMIEGAPRKTRDGEDEMLQVNVLSEALLIDLLEDNIGKDGKYSRVLFVGSTLHRKVLPGSCTPETLSDAWNNFDPDHVYQITKFIQVYLLYMTTQRFEQTKPGVTAVVVSPGFVPDTGLGRELGVIKSGIMHYLLPKTPFATTVPDGGKHIVSGLTGSYVTGTYVTQRGIEDTAEDTYHEELRAAWREWFVGKGIWHAPPPPAQPVLETEQGGQVEVQPVQGEPAAEKHWEPEVPADKEKTATAVPAEANPLAGKVLPVQPVTDAVSGVPQQAPVVEGAAAKAEASPAPVAPEDKPAPAATTGGKPVA